MRQLITYSLIIFVIGFCLGTAITLLMVAPALSGGI